MSILLAVTDAAVVVKRVSRFTDEVFAGLISLIFTISAILDLIKIHSDGSDELCSLSAGGATGTQMANLSTADLLSVVNEDDAATALLPCLTLLQLETKTLVSVILAAGTFLIAMDLKALRGSLYAAPWLRNFLADFGVAIAIFAMVLVSQFVFTSDVDLLKMPDEFEPTMKRDWFVGLGGLPVWAVFLSILPAMMGMVLVWLDNNITYRLVNSPDHKLTKGTAYHWDTLITGIFIAVVSLFGLPWLVAATVRSLLLVKSLAKSEEVNGKSRIVHVNDNRFTGFAIHTVLLVGVFVPQVLQKIPMPVIFGLFLYMGVGSMGGNTMFERALMMAIWETKHMPEESYMKKVPRGSIVKFTLVQLASLAVLYVVKSTPVGISFPLFIAVLPAVRAMISKSGLVPEEECELLDPEELPEDALVGADAPNALDASA